MDFNMISAEEARKLAAIGYERQTATLHQAIRSRSMEGFCFLRIDSENFGLIPEGVLKDLISHGYKLIIKDDYILITW